MDFLAAALLLLCQGIEPQPEPGRVGTEVEVAVRGSSGEPLPGVLVVARHPDGSEARVGTTGADGIVRFVPVQAGTFELRVDLGELRVIRPYTVLAPPRRWLYVLLCLPAGVVLLLWNLRAPKRTEPPADTGG